MLAGGSGGKKTREHSSFRVIWALARDVLAALRWEEGVLFWAVGYSVVVLVLVGGSNVVCLPLLWCLLVLRMHGIISDFSCCCDVELSGFCVPFLLFAQCGDPCLVLPICFWNRFLVGSPQSLSRSLTFSLTLLPFVPWSSLSFISPFKKWHSSHYFTCFCDHPPICVLVPGPASRILSSHNPLFQSTVTRTFTFHLKEISCPFGRN